MANCCVERLVKSNVAPVLVPGATATITLFDTSLEAFQKYALRYCVRWADASGNEALQLTVNGTTYGVLTPLGVPAVVSEIRRREVLRLKFIPTVTAPVAIPSHFVILNELCPRTFIVSA